MCSFTGLLAAIAMSILLSGACNLDTTSKLAKAEVSRKAEELPQVVSIPPGHVGFLKEPDTSNGRAPGAPTQYVISHGPFAAVEKMRIRSDMKLATIACGNMPFTYRYTVGDGHPGIAGHHELVEISGSMNVPCDDDQLLWKLAMRVREDDVAPEEIYYDLYMGAVDFTGYAGPQDCANAKLALSSQECQKQLRETLLLYMGDDRPADLSSIRISVTAPDTH